MPFRYGAAAMMAAICATLIVLVVRAVVDPPVETGVGMADREAFIFQRIGTGLLGGLVYQLAFGWRGLPGYAGGLAWGAGGFAAAVLAPLAVMPALPPGVPPLEDAGQILFWLFTIALSGWGLWWLLRPDAAAGLKRRAFGVVLLLVPGLLAPAEAWQEQTALPETGGDPLAGLSAADFGLLFGLNLLFWLCLGFFSVLAARRVMRQGVSPPG